MHTKSVCESLENMRNLKIEMGFKTSSQLKAAYMSALIAEGKVPAIKGGRGAGKAEKAKEVGVGKRGSIIISKELIERLGSCG